MYEEVKDTPIEVCPHCGSTKLRKAGLLPNGFQRYHCKNCGKKLSAYTVPKYFRTTDISCPHCGSYRTRLAGHLQDGTRRHICKNCGKGFSAKTIIREPITEHCPVCESSNLRREGTRNNLQRYRCRDCGKTFTAKRVKRKYNPRRNKAQRLYRVGTTVPKIAKILNLTVDTIREYVRKSDHERHINEYIKTLPEKLKKDIIYFRLGAGVSYEDINYYLKVEEKGAAPKIIDDYLRENNADSKRR